MAGLSILPSECLSNILHQVRERYLGGCPRIVLGSNLFINYLDEEEEEGLFIEFATNTTLNSITNHLVMTIEINHSTRSSSVTQFWKK